MRFGLMEMAPGQIFKIFSSFHFPWFLFSLLLFFFFSFCLDGMMRSRSFFGICWVSLNCFDE